MDLLYLDLNVYIYNISHYDSVLIKSITVLILNRKLAIKFMFAYIKKLNVPLQNLSTIIVLDFYPLTRFLSSLTRGGLRLEDSVSYIQKSRFNL